ncbi:class I adenylate-forming enzyme family protein [Ramlibacter sp.]|uniref:class I adenylate-forming enzyme family protein n=1 Tax=Ramlibacter sp. TaxID=1917967 RepID=UPI003D0ACD00
MTHTLLTLLSREALERCYAAGHWKRDTLFSLAQSHAAARGARTAVRSSAGSLSYRDLLQRAEALATHLSAAGLRRGDRVAAWLSSRIETVVVMVACSRSGFVCCPSLHRDHTSAQVLELMQRMGAAAFVGESGYGADASRRDIFAELGTAPTLKVHWQLGRPGSDDPRPLPAEPAPGQPGPCADPDCVSSLAFTSGTTGQPKGVMHSDNTLLANARSMIADWRFDERLVLYTLSPISHSLGMLSMVTTLAVGGELVVHDLARGASLLDRLGEVGATFAVGVPTHAMDLLAELDARDARPPASLVGFRVSGASPPRSLIAQLLERGVTPQSGYGMTESGSTHYTRMNDAVDRIVETSGQVCDSFEVRVFSQENPDLEAGVDEIGEIGGRGASLMLGYFDDQRANDAAFNAGGWFMTGDLGRIDAQGYLRITGRKKDLIIRGGHNIHPARIEGLAMQHPAVERACAVPVADERLGEKVCLAVMFRSGRNVPPEELLAHLDRAGLSRYDMPEYFLALADIPLTPSGKILKRDVAVRVAQGLLSPTPVRFEPGA